MLSQPGRRRRGRSQRPVALDYKGGQLQRVLALASVCAVVSEIHSSVGEGEILYQSCKEGVSTLKKCSEYKGPSCQCSTGRSGKAHAFIWGEGTEEEQ